MQNWDDLRFLVALSKTGTMTAAAKLLGTNTATVSRRIERLSETLGTPAFVKTSEGWHPSPAVKKLIEVAEDFDGNLQSVINERIGDSIDQTVEIGIGAVPVVTSTVLLPGLRQHRSMLDGISVTFSDRVFREGLGDSDLVVMYGQPEHGRIVTRKAGELQFRLYSPAGWTDSGQWAGLLDAHDTYPPMRMGQKRFGCAPKLRVASFSALASLMEITGLPGPLPDIMAQRLDGFTHVPVDEPPFRADFWIMFHETRRNDPAMRRTVAWIMRCFEDAAALQDGRLPVS